MNIEIAKERYKEVLRVDVITNTQGDFLATHVPFKKLYVTKYAELTTEDYKKPLSEKEVYDLLVTPREDDQFVLVKGDSGTGKSHLIRWFQAMLMANKPDSEAVLFVRRNDNTLKGTIKQLLEMEEVKNLPDAQIYKKLVNAGAAVPEQELKSNIYYYYIAKIDSDDGKGDNIKQQNEEERERYFSRADRSHLSALFTNDAFKTLMFADGGPIDRIYSKFAEKDHIDEDDKSVAGFVPEDFIIDSSFRDTLVSQEADRKARKFADKLYADDDNSVKKSLAEYLNTFNESVIRRCTGLEAGDLNEVFADIRRELAKQGKSLTIFIEDVTSFTGVNSELLDALMTSHSGAYSEAKMCRLNAIVGATEGYYADSFRDNFKVRISNFITVPGDIFAGDMEGLYEFFARYLNTLSLRSSTIRDWVKDKNASEEAYPVHQVTEGAEWDYYTLEDGKKLNLFPFDRNAIRFLYRGQEQNQRTPRMLMRNIIEPHLVDVFERISQFPTVRLPLKGIDSNLNNILLNRSDITSEEKFRMAYFMSVWGNATNDVFEREDGVKTIATIPESIYKIFGLQIVEGKTIAQQENKLEDEPQPEPAEKDDKKDSAVENRIREAMELVEKWMSTDKVPLRVNQTAGVNGIINNVRSTMNNYVKGSIDWLSEGVSLDTFDRMEDHYNKWFVGFGNQLPKSTSIVELSPSNFGVQKIIEGFIRYNLEGKKSWNFPNSNDYLLTITAWFESVKPKIVKAMRTFGETETRYMNYGIASELYRLILNGYCSKSSSLAKIDPLSLFNANEPVNEPNAHSKDWNSLLTVVNNQRGMEIHNDVLQYFNLPQGGSKNSKNFILDYEEYLRHYAEVISTGLQYTKDDLQLNDPVKRRCETSEQLNRILSNTDKVIANEKATVQEQVKIISKHVDLETITDEELSQLLTKARRFYTNASDNQLGVKILIGGRTNEDNFADFTGKSEEIISAFKTAQQALKTEDTAQAMLLLSKDPLYVLRRFAFALSILADDIDAIQKRIQNYKQGGSSVGESGDSQYQDDLNDLKKCREILEEVKDNDNH